MFKHSTKLEKLNETEKASSSRGFLGYIANIEIKAAIKIGIAAALSLFTGIWFSKLQARPDTLVSGLWCVVSSIVVLQAHLGGTYKAAWQRFLGVLIGSILGCFLTWQFGSNPISLGIAVSATVLLCTFFRLQESVRIACLTVAVIMILSGLRPDINLMWFGIYRFLDSCLGIFLAVVVAHTLWPEEATEKIEHNIAKMLNSLSKLFHMSIELEPDRERLDKLFVALKEEVDGLLEDTGSCLDEAKLELAMRQTNLDDWKAMFVSLENTSDAIFTLKHLTKSKLLLILDESLLSKLKEFSDSAEASLLQLSRKLDAGDKSLAKAETDDDDLSRTFLSLKEDLIRFRGTRATRQFDWKEIESFFVFFYSIGMVAEEIFKMKTLVPKI